MYKFSEIPFSKLRKREVLSWIEETLTSKKSVYIVTPNPEMMIESRKNPEFKAVLQASDLSVCDGVGIMWASLFTVLPERFRWFSPLNFLWTFFQMIWTLSAIILYPPYLQKHISERITGADLFWDMIRICNELEKRPFFLGAAPGMAERVRDKVLTIYPDLQIAGTFAGFSDKESDEETRRIIDDSEADLVFVAFSFPKQELWMSRNLHKFKNPKMLIGLGGTFDYVAGKRKRAPRFLRRVGLEWFFRLLTQPWRYFRIYTATIRFIRFVWKLKKDRGERYET